MTPPAVTKFDSRVTAIPAPLTMPAPLKGSLESLERQNVKTDKDNLERILDEDDLKDRIANKVLVPIPVSASLAVNTNLPETHRYVRPWTATFLSDLSEAHAQHFQDPLQVTSAVRTVEYQKQLMQVNGNATNAEGDIVSPHLTGATIDIGKGAMSRAEIAWMRNRLEQLQLQGKIDVEEEFHQACFHITVYKAYVPGPSPAEPVHRARHRAAAQTASVASEDQPQQ
jgi:LAS superfamily LD-carboxypeptidase LdcB